MSDAYKMLSGASKNNTKLKKYSLRICSDFVASPVFFQHLRWSDVGSSKRSGAQNSYKKQTFFINGLWRRLGGDAGWSEGGPELRRGQKSCMDWFSVASRVRRRRKARLPAPKKVTSVFDFLVCVATGGSGYLHRGIRLGGGGACIDPYSRNFKSSHDDPKYAYFNILIIFSHFRNELN